MMIQAQNLTLNEFYYTNDECQVEAYEAYVAGINGAGIGLYSDSINMTLGCKEQFFFVFNSNN